MNLGTSGKKEGEKKRKRKNMNKYNRLSYSSWVF